MGTQGNRVELRKGLMLDVDKRELIHNGLAVSLSNIQFRILHFLTQRLGRPVATQDIIDYAWGTGKEISKSELYVYMSRIRSRIGDNPRSPRFLISIRGFGYILRGERSSS